MKIIQTLFRKLPLVAVCVGCLFTLFTGCSTTSQTQRGLVGKWQSGFGGVTYEFLPDHTYVYSQTLPGIAMTWRGRYEVESPNLLILTRENDGQAMQCQAMQFVLKGASRLWSTLPGSLKKHLDSPIIHSGSMPA